MILPAELAQLGGKNLGALRFIRQVKPDAEGAACGVEHFVDAGHDVTVYDDLSSGHASAVVRPARLERGQIEDRAHLERLLREDRIEAVLHCAAKSLVGESMSNPGLYYRNNVGGGVTLLEAMRTVGVNRLVFSSTAIENIPGG